MPRHYDDNHPALGSQMKDGFGHQLLTNHSKQLSISAGKCILKFV